MKKKLAVVVIFIVLATTIIPNFIYATNIENLEVNRENFLEAQKNFSLEEFTQMTEEATADLRSDRGNKKKKIQETFSLAAGGASAFGTWIMLPFSIASTLITLTTRGADNLFIKAGEVTSWNQAKTSTVTSDEGYAINWYTIEDTVFGKISLFDTDFFLESSSNKNQVNAAIKGSIATYYYFVRVIAIIIMLCLLIYTGIRMALSTVAADIAKYKDMLTDWFVSMVLIFTLPYIVGFINMISTGLTYLFETFKSENGFEQSIIWQAHNVINITSGWSYVAMVIMYLALTYYHVKFFWMYAKRFLAMGFLIVISPIVAAMYSATKTNISGNGGKAGALDTWIKEYSINAFIMPLHAGIYLVFILSANNIFMVAPFLAVLFFMALSRGERIVKNIFGMRQRTSINSLAGVLPFKK